LAYPAAQAPLSRRDRDYAFYVQEWCAVANTWMAEWGQ
jgi:hypothetical protein